MTTRKTIGRRRFLAEGSAAVVGAAAAGGALDAAARVTSDATPAIPASNPSPTFTAESGATIPYRRDELLSRASRSFTGRQLNEIAFPLGGIGTGTISLGGRGDLRDWEIFNRPNKNKALPFTFVALWARERGGAAAMKIVEAPLQPPFRGRAGYPRERAQGIPHFKGARFGGSYPIAEIDFDDPALPVDVRLEAFNPFVPLDTNASSLPVAIFRYTLRNRTKNPVDAALAFSMLNAIGYDGKAALGGHLFAGFGKNVTRFKRDGAIAGLEFTSLKYPVDDERAGSMALVTTTSNLSARARWEAGGWYDSFQKWLDEYGASGQLEDIDEAGPSAEGASNFATLAPRVALAPGETRHVEFVLAWYFPNRVNYWNQEPEVRNQKLRNDYGSRFSDAWDVARHTVANLPRLERDTRAFRDALSSSTLPAVVVDAVSSQMSIIRTNTCLLLEGQQFFAFEGTNDESGCCPLNCTHVWNYEQTLAHLFPDLERSMRVTDFTVNLKADGAMAFRTLVPTGKAVWAFKAAADGQMGCVLKLYREWQQSGDEAFLRRLWPAAKRALEYAWKVWDIDRDGVMEGTQHNTYDIDFFGANTMMGTLYLGALLAAERMARAVGDAESATLYRRVFEDGRTNLDAALWSDGFYIQQAPDDPRYQYGAGCLSDQLLGQWFAAVVGLGHLLPADRIKAALASIYRFNFKHTFENHPNAQRIFAVNDEKGLVLCSWPRGKRPALPFVYSDEVWTGIEYQVAAHLMYEGYVMEGLAVTKAARDRYDGERRNPWNEVECGSHYARALSSWSLLTALSGYHYSAPERRLSFAPALTPQDFRCLFTTGSGWGVFAQTMGPRGSSASLELRGGTLSLSQFGFAPTAPATGDPTATINRRPCPVTRAASGLMLFAPAVSIAAGDRLEVSVRNPGR
jgi:uncharacterized protein (DUF608 family)